MVAAVECAIAIQKLMTERNAETPEDKRILYRIGINLGDVLVEGDDIFGDGVNIAARLEGICEPGGDFRFRRRLRPCSRACRRHLRRSRREGPQEHRSAGAGLRDRTRLGKRGARAAASAPNTQGPPRLSIVVLPFANMSGDPEQEYFVDGVTESLTTDLSRISGSFVIARNTAFTYKGKPVDVEADRPRVERPLCPRGQRSARRQPDARQRPAHRRRERQSSMGGAVRQAGGRPLRHAGRDRRAPRQRAQRATRCSRSAARGASAKSRLDGPLFSGHGLGEKRASPSKTLRRRAACSSAPWRSIPPTSSAGRRRGGGRQVALAFVADDRAARSCGRRSGCDQGCVLGPRTMPSPILTWAWSTASPTAPFRPSLNASGRWSWTETWPPLTRKSARTSSS